MKMDFVNHNYRNVLPIQYGFIIRLHRKRMIILKRNLYFD
ncbi:hypothetical protein BLA29_011353 [Euroglyphus maynei]|uniref:Uncharacterized protein n=1 Tax=Euroglyphus maynei TaxID=6958 RepID=A0A1Y3BGY1_EURMA|nr:hypothetical protein BLA29_011353 [Euroglyphus maynei]